MSHHIKSVVCDSQDHGCAGRVLACGSEPSVRALQDSGGEAAREVYLRSSFIPAGQSCCKGSVRLSIIVLMGPILKVRGESKFWRFCKAYLEIGTPTVR